MYIVFSLYSSSSSLFPFLPLFCFSTSLLFPNLCVCVCVVCVVCVCTPVSVIRAACTHVKVISSSMDNLWVAYTKGRWLTLSQWPLTACESSGRGGACWVPLHPWWDVDRPHPVQITTALCYSWVQEAHHTKNTVFHNTPFFSKSYILSPFYYHVYQGLEAVSRHE